MPDAGCRNLASGIRQFVSPAPFCSALANRTPSGGHWASNPSAQIFMPRLLFLNRELAGYAWDLNVERTTIGRREANTLPIPDETVSGEHCEILVFGAEVIVRERGSTNGTFVGATKVVGQLPAKDRDVLRFGSVEARLEFEPDASDGSTDLTAIWLHSQLKRQPQSGRGAPLAVKATIKLPLERLPPPPRSRRRPSDHWMRDIAVPAGILLLAIAALLALWFGQ
jgi:hypothetical protein